MKQVYLYIFLLIAHAAVAQEFQLERKINPFPVLDENGVAFDLPFLGGLNTPIQQFLDIDGDGDVDLFVQDRANQLLFFRNTGDSQNYQFEWETDRFGDLDVGLWFKFADVDGDNDFDLFAENPFGIIQYYRNIGDANSPDFVQAADSLKDNNGAIIVVDGFSIPEWADLDGDGNLELYLGRQTGATTQYTLTGFDANNAPVYQFVTDSFEDLLILTGGGRASDNPGSERHGANSLTFVDIDADGDRDLFWGDFFAESIIFVENKGTQQTPVFNTADIVSEYPPGSPIQTGAYNVPRFADIDGDGDADMFVSVIGGFISFIKDKAENFYFFENTGAAAQADFVLRDKSFINSIDIGQNATPTFVDVDADGDFDMFLANQEDLAAPNRANSRLYFFENTGSPGSPAFSLRSKNYLNFDKQNDVNYAPVFADIDADGDTDLFVGKWDGTIAFYRNDGSENAPSFTRVSETYGNIDVGNNNTPAFADIDADNDLDLFCGEFSGNINFYRNIGSPANAVFALDTTHYFGINLGPTEYSYPKFTDIDGDTDLDLFLGSEDKGVLFYRNTGTPQQAIFVQDNAFQLPRHIRTSPNWLDIDNDGDLDLFSGVNGGGVVFYENRKIVTGLQVSPIPQNLPGSIRLLKNYPNPFNPETTIKYEVKLSGNPAGKSHSLTIYNILGQEIRTWRFANTPGVIRRNVAWDATGSDGKPVPSGVYFYQLRATRGVAKTGKMLLVR